MIDTLEIFYDLDVKAIDQKNNRKYMTDLRKRKDRYYKEILALLQKIKRRLCRYMYEGIQSEVISTTRFDESLDLSMTYIGRIDISRISKIKAEEKFPVSEQGYIVGKLLEGTECQILLDTEASIIYVGVNVGVTVLICLNNNFNKF